VSASVKGSLAVLANLRRDMQHPTVHAHHVYGELLFRQAAWHEHCYIPFFMLLISRQFARSASMAFRITRRIVATAEDSEDAVQDSLQQALTHFKSSKGDSRISTWLSRIVTNAALTRLAQEQRPS
jgi:hypothetical protein